MAMVNEKYFGITFQDFENILELIHKYYTWRDKLYQYGIDVVNSPSDSLAEKTIELLTNICHDDYGWIEYFCHELYFGEYDDLDAYIIIKGVKKELKNVTDLWEILTHNEGEDRIDE